MDSLNCSKNCSSVNLCTLFLFAFSSEYRIVQYLVAPSLYYFLNSDSVEVAIFYQLRNLAKFSCWEFCSRSRVQSNIVYLINIIVVFVVLRIFYTIKLLLNFYLYFKHNITNSMLWLNYWFEYYKQHLCYSLIDLI